MGNNECLTAHSLVMIDWFGLLLALSLKKLIQKYQYRPNIKIVNYIAITCFVGKQMLTI